MNRCIGMLFLGFCSVLSTSCWVEPSDPHCSGDISCVYCDDCGQPPGTWGGAGGTAATGGGYVGCQSSSECPADLICDPLAGACVPIVADCPLTDECLADPVVVAPDWQGIDPTFAGTLVGDGREALLGLDIDFYPDHLYGEGVLVVVAGQFSADLLPVIITGSRDGEALWGQIVDQSGSGRSFDAVFTAALPTASEIVGEVVVSSDTGEFQGEFHLFRTSACGCDDTTNCQSDSDCRENEICGGGLCWNGRCEVNADCPPGEGCYGGECARPCASDADCEPGDVCIDGLLCGEATPSERPCEPECSGIEECNEGTCQVPCTLTCECELGEECVEGFCAPEENDLPTPCETDCDCQFAGGERCVDGECTMP